MKLPVLRGYEHSDGTYWQVANGGSGSNRFYTWFRMHRKMGLKLLCCVIFIRYRPQKRSIPV